MEDDPERSHERHEHPGDRRHHDHQENDHDTSHPRSKPRAAALPLHCSPLTTKYPALRGSVAGAAHIVPQQSSAYATAEQTSLMDSSLRPPMRVVSKV